MFDSMLLERIGWVLVHSIWQIALASFVFAMLNRMMVGRSANARYLLGCATLLATVAAPVATFFVVHPTTTPRVTDVAALETIATERDNEAIPTTERTSSPDLLVSTSLSGGQRDGLATLPTVDIERSTAATGASVDTGGKASDWRLQFNAALPTVVIVWFVGVVLLSARPIIGLYTVHQLKRTGTSPVPDEVENVLRRIAKQMRFSSVVQIAQSTRVAAPSVMGWLRPIILLPVSVVTSLTPKQLEAVLAHELAHIRRHDYLVNLLQTITETMFFYHPGVWWVSRQLRIERENCCDDFALTVCEDRVGYARALTTLAELQAEPQLAMAATGGSLIHRVRRILHPTSATQHGSWLAGGLSLLALFFLVAGAMYGASSAHAQPAKDETTKRPAGSRPVDPKWATLKGRFLFNGVPPEPAQFPMVRQQHLHLKVYDESLKVGKNNGVENIVVYIRRSEMPVHPPYQKTAKQPLTIQVKDGRLIPHLTVMRTSQPLTFKNRQPWACNLMMHSTQNDAINFLMPKDGEKQMSLPKPERLPTMIAANIQPWLRGWVLTLDHPYSAATGNDGSFQIDKLPVGEWEFVVWHEKAGFIKTSQWPKGRFKLKIKPGENDLGTIRLTPSQFGLPDQVNAGGQKKPNSPNKKSLRGLDLSKVPGTTDGFKIKALYHEAKPGSKRYLNSGDSFQMPIGTDFWLYYLYEKKIYYLKETTTNDTAVYYGPISGNPFKDLDLIGYLADLLNADPDPNGGPRDPRTQMECLMEHDDPLLVRHGWEVLIRCKDWPYYTLDHYAQILAKAKQKNAAKKNKDPLVTKTLLAATRRVDQERQKAEDRKVAIPDDQYQVGRKPTEAEEKLSWGKAVKGLQAALTSWQKERQLRFGDRVEATVLVRNTSDRAIKFSVFDPGMGTSADVVDPQGKTQHMPGGPLLTGEPSVGRFRLEAGQVVALNTVRFDVVRENESSRKQGISAARCKFAQQYRVRCDISIPDGHMGTPEGMLVPAKGEWEGRLTTGDASFIVTAPQDKPTVKDLSNTKFLLEALKKSSLQDLKLADRIKQYEKAYRLQTFLHSLQNRGGKLEVRKNERGSRIAWIRLSDTKLFKELEKAKVPEFIILDGAKFTDKSVPMVGRFRWLKTVELIETAITEEGRKKLQKLLPKCRIVVPKRQ